MAWVVVDYFDLDLSCLYDDMEWILLDVVEFDVTLLEEETVETIKREKEKKKSWG